MGPAPPGDLKEAAIVHILGRFAVFAYKTVEARQETQVPLRPRPGLKQILPHWLIVAANQLYTRRTFSEFEQDPVCSRPWREGHEDHLSGFGPTLGPLRTA